jgi:hypothetical protein
MRDASVLYGVSAADPLLFARAAILLMLAALLACAMFPRVARQK